MSVNKETELTHMQKLQQVKNKTNSDGTVNVTCNGFYQTDSGDAALQIVTPNGKETVNVYPWPEKYSSEYKIVRIAERYANGVTGLDDLASMPVTARAEISESGDVSIIAPEPFDVYGVIEDAVIFGLLAIAASIAILIPAYGIFTLLGLTAPINTGIYFMLACIWVGAALLFGAAE